MNKREEFEMLVGQIKREGIKELLEWLRKSDFYTAPASSRFHGSYEGGLLEHSLNVYHELKRILAVYPEIEVEDESILVSALFHDLCKVNMYATEKRNRKNEQGQWESYDAYTIKEKFHFGGHGSKSVFIIQQFMKLTPLEAVAINCHMGAWGDNPQDVSKAYEQYPFAWALHVADESATYVLEANKGV